MKIPFTYGAALAVASMGLTLVQYFLGMHDDVSKVGTGQKTIIFASVLITIAFLTLAMRATRAKATDGTLSYGRAIGTGALTMLFSGFFSALFVLLYGMVINPQYHELLYLNAMRELPAGQEERAEGMVRFFTGPIFLALMVFVFSIIFGVIASLVIALFVKKEAPFASASLPPRA